MSIDTLTLQSFIIIAETGSFTKAADRVGRTQSALSQQVAKLESLLGKQLFIRGKIFSLSREGEIFLDYAKQIFALHREVLDRFKEPELKGEIRFGLPEDFASVYLSDVLVSFSRIHPRISLNIECDLTLNLFARFKRKEFDLVLLKMSRPKDFPNAVDVYSEEIEWVGANNFHLHDRTKPIPLILSPKPCVYRARAIAALERVGIKWRIIFTSTSYAGTIAAAKAGLGITVLPRTIIPEYLTVINGYNLPDLEDTHICLLKNNLDNKAILSFENFVLNKLKH